MSVCISWAHCLALEASITTENIFEKNTKIIIDMLSRIWEIQLPLVCSVWPIVPAPMINCQQLTLHPKLRWLRIRRELNGVLDWLFYTIYTSYTICPHLIYKYPSVTSFFFLVGGKLVNQHGIAPIVWAWLSWPTKNLPVLWTPPELLTWVRSKGNVALSPLLRAGMPY